VDNPAIATPLKLAKFDTDGLTVVERGSLNKINLRGNFESPSVNSALSDLLGFACELSPNTFISDSASTLFWLGPNERLLYTDADPAGIADKWKANSSTAAVDVSDYYTILRLSGAKARDVIASGSPFDVHADVFGSGQCTQTRFGNASVLISNHADTPVFQLQVRWSYAEYVFDYIKRVSAYV